MSPLSFSSVIHLRTCCRAPSAAALAGRVGDTESSASVIVTLLSCSLEAEFKSALDFDVTSSGYKQEIGLRSVDSLPFVVTSSTAPRIWPSSPVITEVTLPSFHKVHG